MRAMLSGITLFMMSAPLATMASSLTEAECLDKADTALERVYCQVKARGEGESLPNLEEFRKNSEAAQKELLWAPARRADVSLPGSKKLPDYRARALPMGIRYAPPAEVSEEERSKMVAHSGPLRVGSVAGSGAAQQQSVQTKQATRARSVAPSSAARTQTNVQSQIVEGGALPVAAMQAKAVKQAPTAEASQRTASAATSSAARPATPDARQTAPAQPVASNSHNSHNPSTSHNPSNSHSPNNPAVSSAKAVASAQTRQRGPACALRGQKIDCGSTYYQLLMNRPKHTLAESALTQSNRLELPPFAGNVQDEAAVRAYLNQAYAAYINKMIELGLAGSTMSFTTFYYSFKDQTQRNVDFVGRFETMFEFLKKDRQRLAVSTAMPSELPHSLGQCATLSSEIIVCDNQTKNWVYVRNETL